MTSFVTQSADGTFNLGRALGERLTGGDVVCLTGELGAGKTLFAQGIAAGLGITEEVTSPTFSLMQIYETGRIPVHHFDLYRLDNPIDLYNIGFEEYVGGTGAAIIEWADKFTEEMPERRLWVTISRGGETTERLIMLQPKGERYQRLGEELKESADSGAGYCHVGV